MPDDSSDISAMLRLSSGDDLALNELMNKWKERLGAFLYRMTSDRETALDLTQETFVRLYISRHNYKPSAPFSTYLFHIASNLAKSHARWKRRHPSVPLDDGEGQTVYEPEDPYPAPDKKAEFADRTREARAAIAALPDDLRQAILLFTIEGLSHAEIGKILDCSEKAAEVKIYRARKALKTSLEGK